MNSAASHKNHHSSRRNHLHCNKRMAELVEAIGSEELLVPATAEWWHWNQWQRLVAVALHLVSTLAKPWM
jgi:hypothetical protein